MLEVRIKATSSETENEYTVEANVKLCHVQDIQASVPI